MIVEISRQAAPTPHLTYLLLLGTKALKKTPSNSRSEKDQQQFYIRKQRSSPRLVPVRTQPPEDTTENKLVGGTTTKTATY